MNEIYSNEKYLIINEILNAITHAIATILSMVGLIILLVKAILAEDPIQLVSYTIYGSSMLTLFLSSTLYHSLIFTGASKILRIFDHSSIFIFIAGSYTPYCLLSIKGVTGWVFLVLIWLIAAMGILYKCLMLNKCHFVSKISSIVYIAMGWLCIFASHSLYHSLGLNGFCLLVAGGLTYTTGTFFYNLEKIKFMHVVWHVFVMLGAIFIFFSILNHT
ncbi:hemolysin III family protein [Enterococcus faecium]|nr:hemolysin III family protein [Enterococcus faecium]